MKVTRTAVAATVAAAVAAVVMGAPPASAAPADTMDLAFDRTIARAEARGVAADTTVRSSLQQNLESTPVVIPPRTPVTIRWSSSPAGSSSWKVTQGRTLLGAAGVNDRDGAWGTLSALAHGDARTFAASRGLRMTSALTGLDAVWGYDGPDGGRPFPGDPWTIDSLGTTTLRYLLPATGGRPSQSWTDMRQTRASGGRTIITAKADAGGACSFPRIRVVLKGGVIQSSSWTEKCGAASTSYSTRVTYRPQVTKASSKALTEDAAFAIPVAGEDPSWPAIVKAVLRTANGAGVRPGTGSSDMTDRPSNSSYTSREAVLLNLMPLYTAMQAGNPGTIEGLVAPSDPPVYTYVITPSAGATSLGTGEDRNPIKKIELTIGADDLLRTLTVTQQVPALADPVMSTATFFPLNRQS